MVDENLRFDNLSSICRTCLSQCGASSLLTIEEVHFISANVKLIEVLMKYTDIEDKENYPQNICCDCIVKAEAAYIFFEKCNESNSLLHKSIYRMTTDDKETEGNVCSQEDGSKFEVITIKNEDLEDVEIKIILDENETLSQLSDDEEHSETNFLKSDQDKLNNQLLSIETCKFCCMKVHSEEIEEHKTTFGHFNGSESFLCPYCDLFTNLRNITAFKTHIRTHGKGKKKHTCDICGKVFKWAKKYTEHMKTHGFEEETFMCPDCGILLSSITALQIHRGREHAQTTSDNWRCRYCQQEYSQIGEFKRHLKEVHAEKDYHCVICGKDCEDRRTLYYHEQLHLDEFGIECSYCHKKLLTEEKLMLHERIHKYVKKKHVCHICSKGFKQMDKLEAHIRIHTGEKPFVCSFCNKAFNHQNNLTHHLRLHTGDTPYKCLFCSVEFSNSHTLRKHMSRHEEEKNEEYISTGK